MRFPCLVAPVHCTSFLLHPGPCSRGCSACTVIILNRAIEYRTLYLHTRAICFNKHIFILCLPEYSIQPHSGEFSLPGCLTGYVLALAHCSETTRGITWRCGFLCFLLITILYNKCYIFLHFTPFLHVQARYLTRETAIWALFIVVWRDGIIWIDRMNLFWCKYIK